MSRVKEGRHYQRRHEWSERQEQVFDLLVKGYTNREIAETLGISLDGAKYHVSELITRLGVETREQAADYWRQRQSVRGRLRSAAHAFAAPLTLRWIAAAGGAVVLAGIVAAVAVVLLQDGDGREAAAPDVTPTVVATPTPPATPDDGNDDAPGDGFPAAEIDGVPVEEMDIGEPIELPEGMVVYFQMLVPETDGGPRNIWRAYQDVSGTTHVEDLLDGLPAPREHVLSVVVAPQRGELMIAACDGEPCGAPYLLPEATVAIFRSTDGGVTWEPYGTLSRPAYLLGLAGEGSALIDDVEGEGFPIHPSGDVVEPPEGVGMARPNIVDGLGLVWIDEDGAHFSAEGDELWAPDHDGARMSAVTASGEQYVSWRPPEPMGPERYLAIREPTGEVSRIFAIPGNWGSGPYVPLSPSLVVSTAIYDPEGDSGMSQDIALLDLNAGEVRPVPGIRPEDELPRAPFFEGVVAGSILRVDTGGSCLNVREGPSTEAEVIRCYVDGVLLFEREADDDVDGWLPVRTPDGREGWAAEEFLAR